MNRATEVCNEFVERLQIPEEIEKQLKTLLLKFPNGIKQKDFSEVFSKEFGQSLNFRDYKTSCLLEMCIRLPHIFKIKNSCGPPAFFPASSIWHWPFEHCISNNDSGQMEVNVPEDVQVVIPKIVSGHDPSRQLTDKTIVDEYKRFTKSGKIYLR